MSDYQDLADALFGSKRLEAGHGAGTSTIYGTATTGSADGAVRVNLGDYITAIETDATDVEVPTTVNVLKGETVVITLVGNHPVVTGVVGVGDRQQGEINEATDYAKTAKEASEKAVASATSAQESAEKALTFAEQANAAADSAITDAKKANNAAKSAQDDATAAKESAQSAIDSAATANDNASKAITYATAANDAAKSAQSDAYSASSSALTAGKAAATAQAAAEAAQADIDETQKWFYHDALGAHVLSSDGKNFRADVLPDALEVVDTNTQETIAHFGIDGSTFAKDRDFKMGSDNAYMRYNAETDSLEIRAKTISIGSSDVTSAITDAKTVKDAYDSGALSATTIDILSTSSTVFKTNVGQTTLKAIVRNGSVTMETSEQLVARFGAGAHISWRYKRGEDTDWQEIPASDSRLSDNGMNFTITADDVSGTLAIQADVVTPD